MKHTQPPSLILTLSWTICPADVMELKSALIVVTLLQVKKKKNKKKTKNKKTKKKPKKINHDKYSLGNTAQLYVLVARRIICLQMSIPIESITTQEF